MNSLSNRKMNMDLSKGSKNSKSTISYSASSEINCPRSLEEKTSSIVSLTSYSTLNTEKVKAENQNEDYSNNINLITVDFKWKNITDVNLKLRYAKIFSNITSKYIFDRLENETKYYSGDLLKVMVYGKWHNIPRKQVAFGDDCLSYKFSGISLPSKPWQSCPIIYELKKCVEQVTAESFNFVLVNRYKDGEDHMGEHRDDEKDLEPIAPIASLSFGQVREFIFRHMDSRGKNKKLNIPRKTIELESGSLLLMDYPTNKFWYHSLPVRKKALGVRINLTFRKMIK